MADKKIIKTIDRTEGFIDIKGPFSLRDRSSAEKVGKNITKLAETFPNATFILRETTRAKGDSVASAAFKKLTTSGLGNRIKVVKANYKGGFKHLGPPGQVRESKIKALKPFKSIDFTFGGDVMSKDYKMWQEGDKALSKAVTWDPLRSTPNPNKKSNIKHLVKKYPGFGATKKIDALIDILSDIGKQGKHRTLVDAGVQYLKDKSDLFYDQQWNKTRKTGVEPIRMLSQDRLDRLEKLQFKYGTPVVQTGKVNLTKGLEGTGLRESGAVSTFAPEGYSLMEDSSRDIDEASTIYKKGEGPLHSVKHDLEGGVAIPQEDLGNVKKVEHRSRQAWRSGNTPKKSTFKFIKDKTSDGGPPPVRSQLTSLDHLQSQKFDDEDAKNKVSYIDEISDTDYESPDISESDKKGGGNINVDTGDYIETKEARLAEELANMPQEVENMYAKKSILTRLHKVTNPETGKQEFVPTEKDFKHIHVPKHRVSVRIPLSPLDKVLANVSKKGIENVSGDEIWQTKETIGQTKKLTRNTSMSDVLYGDAVDTNPDPRHGAKNTTVSATSPDAGDPLTPVNKTKDPTYSLHGRSKPSNKTRDAQLAEANAKGTTTKVVKQTNKEGKVYSKLVMKYAGTGMTIQQQLDKENALHKQRGGSKKDVAQNKYVKFRNQAIKTIKKSGDLVYSQRPATDGMSGPEKRITLKKSINKPKQTESNISRLIKNSSKGAKVVIPTGLGILGWLSTPIVAEASLRSIRDNPTGKERIRQNIATFLGSKRVVAPVGEEPGYLDNVANYNVAKLRESGKRRVPDKHVTGTVTPYDKMKKSLGSFMKNWNAASMKANEAMKLHGGWRFK